MAVLGFVVERRPLLHRLGHPRGVQRRRRIDAEQLLHEIEKIAPVAVRHRLEGLAPLGIDRQGAAHFGLGTGDQGVQGRTVEPLQHEDLTPRKQRAVELKRGVLRRRPDQDHGAVLHHRQEAVLLGPVEAMDFIDEQQRAAAHAATLPRRGEDLLEVGEA